MHATHVIFSFNWFPKSWRKKEQKIIKFFTLFARSFFVKFDWIEFQTYFLSSETLAKNVQFVIVLKNSK